MITETKEKTAINTPVGADVRQPNPNQLTESITDSPVESNENFDELKKKLRRMQDPAYLPTVTMTELYDTVYVSKPPGIDGLIQNGT